MNETSDVESDELCFCPICQAPLNNLKIRFSLHVNTCDVNWDSLQECSEGENCKSESIFHYRDFSHQVLASHRENIMNKRKRDYKGEEKTSKKAKQKENRSVSKRRCSKIIHPPVEEDEDDIFMEPVKSNTNSRASVKPERKSVELKKSNDAVKIDSVKSETSDNNSSSQVGAEGDTSNHKIEPRRNIKSSSTDEKMNHPSIKTEPEQEINFEDNSSYEKIDCDISNEGSSTDHDTEQVATETAISQSIDKACEKKERCKAKWNNIFKSKVKEESLEVPPPVSFKSKQKTVNKFGNKSDSKPPKVCPYFKKMPGTGFAVDAFQYGSIPEVSVYFLSHFHSDHYIGLKKSFAHPIYCSLITANLVKKKLRVHEQYVKVLELNQPVVINQVEVTCFDANHCPGSLLILFRLVNGEQYLHVGDFRASLEMEEEPELRSAQISRLYLDTTYFDPQYVFPSQKDVIDRVRKIVREMSTKYPKALFVSGSYLIGKEKVFLGILEELKCKLWAQPHKRDVFRCMDDQTILSALTDRPEQARVHVLPMNYFRFDRLKKHLLECGPFSHVFAFKPTGWEMGRTKINDWINTTSYENITIYGVPYSEHSNYEELCRFVRFIKADKVIPTVSMRNREMYSHLKQIVDSYKNDIKTNKPKQRSIDQYITHANM